MSRDTFVAKGGTQRQVFQIILTVPEGSGLEKSNEEYAEIMEDILNDKLEAGEVPGASQVELEYVGEA